MDFYNSLNKLDLKLFLNLSDLILSFYIQGNFSFEDLLADGKIFHNVYYRAKN
jgi:hypothetical protein